MRPDPYSWSLHLEATVPVAALVAGYVLAMRRYAAPTWRVACFALGALLLFATAVTPLDSLTYHLLIAHLLQNVVLAEWAPLLLVLGVPAGLAAELARLPGARVLTHPFVVLPLWLATYFVWHLPPSYDAALREPLLLHLEHVMYVAAGVLFWWPALQDEPRRIPPAGRAAYLFAAFVLGSPLGLLLTFLPNAIYDYYVDGGGLWGLSPLTDQQIAGVTMSAEQAVVFFAAFAFFFLRFLAEEERAG